MTRILSGAIALALVTAIGGCGVIKGSKAKINLAGERVAILTSENDVTVEPSLADVQVVLPDPVSNAAWTQSGGSATKAMGHLSLGTSLSRAFDVRIAGASKESRLAAAPVVADGTMYAIDTSSTLAAFDAATGAKRWSVKFGDGGKNAMALFGGGVSVDGDFLYATNGLGDIAALKASNGAIVWKKRLSAPLRGSPTVALGNVYTMSQDNQLFVLRATDGNVEWSEAAAVSLAGVFGVGAPAVGQGTVVAGFSSGDMNAYRYENGRAVWQDTLSRTSINTAVGTLTDVDADPVIDQGRVFAIGLGGRMVSLELVTGQRLWELNIAGLATPWVAGEWVFVVTDQAKLLCIARATGKVRWSAELARYHNGKSKGNPVSWTGPVLAGGRLYLASSDGNLIGVSPGDGAVQSTIKLGAPVYLSPIVAKSTLYVLDNSGRITAFR